MPACRQWREAFLVGHYGEASCVGWALQHRVNPPEDVLLMYAWNNDTSNGCCQHVMRGRHQGPGTPLT